MKTITNEQKAKEIAKKLSYPNIDSFGDGDDEFDTRFYHTIKDAALEAMQWKGNHLISWLDTLNKEIDKLTTGNLAHNKTHIKCLLYEIQEQLKGE